MKARSLSRSGWVAVTGLIFMGVVFHATADSIEMRNGDRYVGTVLSIDAKQLRLKSENLGILRIDRQKIGTVHLGEAAPAPAVAVSDSPRPSTNAVVAVKPTGASSTSGQAVVYEIRTQFLATAGPEANALFDSTVQGVLSGKITVGDIRSQARNVPPTTKATQIVR